MKSLTMVISTPARSNPTILHRRISMQSVPGEMSRRNLIRVGVVTVGAVSLPGAASAAAAAARKSYSRQHDWRWCNYCQCLFYEKDYTSGCCVKKCGHNWRGSGNYYLGYGSGAPGQTNWRWCSRCENLWYNGSSYKGKCAGNSGDHRSTGSGDYHVQYGTPGGGEQPDWKWCKKCYCLCYSGGGDGRCFAGGGHDFSSSGNYYLAYGD
jgi:hypothetical protein